MFSAPPIILRGLSTISSFSLEAVGVHMMAIGATVGSSTPTSNTVSYVPFQIGTSFIVKKVGWVNGTAAGNGNAQVGVYDESFAELFECTATTTSGTSAKQSVDVTDYTLPGPGRYYMAFRMSSGTDRVFASTLGAGLFEACGVMMQTSQSDLPGTATPVANTYAVLPLFYLSGTTLL